MQKIRIKAAALISVLCIAIITSALTLYAASGYTFKFNFGVGASRATNSTGFDLKYIIDHPELGYRFGVTTMAVDNTAQWFHRTNSADSKKFNMGDADWQKSISDYTTNHYIGIDGDSYWLGDSDTVDYRGNIIHAIDKSAPYGQELYDSLKAMVAPNSATSLKKVEGYRQYGLTQEQCQVLYNYVCAQYDKEYNKDNSKYTRDAYTYGLLKTLKHNIETNDVDIPILFCIENQLPVIGDGYRTYTSCDGEEVSDKDENKDERYSYWASPLDMFVRCGGNWETIRSQYTYLNPDDKMIGYTYTDKLLALNAGYTNKKSDGSYAGTHKGTSWPYRWTEYYYKDVYTPNITQLHDNGSLLCHRLLGNTVDTKANIGKYKNNDHRINDTSDFAVATMLADFNQIYDKSTKKYKNVNPKSTEIPVDTSYDYTKFPRVLNTQQFINRSVPTVLNIVPTSNGDIMNYVQSYINDKVSYQNGTTPVEMTTSAFLDIALNKRYIDVTPNSKGNNEMLYRWEIAPNITLKNHATHKTHDSNETFILEENLTGNTKSGVYASNVEPASAVIYKANTVTDQNTNVKLASVKTDNPIETTSKVKVEVGAQKYIVNVKYAYTVENYKRSIYLRPKPNTPNYSFYLLQADPQHTNDEKFYETDNRTSYIQKVTQTEITGSTINDFVSNYRAAMSTAVNQLDTLCRGSNFIKTNDVSGYNYKDNIHVSPAQFLSKFDSERGSRNSAIDSYVNSLGNKIRNDTAEGFRFNMLNRETLIKLKTFENATPFEMKVTIAIVGGKPIKMDNGGYKASTPHYEIVMSYVNHDLTDTYTGDRISRFRHRYISDQEGDTCDPTIFKVNQYFNNIAYINIISYDIQALDNISIHNINKFTGSTEDVLKKAFDNIGFSVYIAGFNCDQNGNGKLTKRNDKGIQKVLYRDTRDTNVANALFLNKVQEPYKKNYGTNNAHDTDPRYVIYSDNLQRLGRLVNSFVLPKSNLNAPGISAAHQQVTDYMNYNIHTNYYDQLYKAIDSIQYGVKLNSDGSISSDTSNDDICITWDPKKWGGCDYATAPVFAGLFNTIYLYRQRNSVKIFDDYIAADDEGNKIYYVGGEGFDTSRIYAGTENYNSQQFLLDREYMASAHALIEHAGIYDGGSYTSVSSIVPYNDHYRTIRPLKDYSTYALEMSKHGLRYCRREPNDETRLDLMDDDVAILSDSTNGYKTYNDVRGYKALFTSQYIKAPSYDVVSEASNKDKSEPYIGYNINVHKVRKYDYADESKVCSYSTTHNNTNNPAYPSYLAQDYATDQILHNNSSIITKALSAVIPYDVLLLPSKRNSTSNGNLHPIKYEFKVDTSTSDQINGEYQLQRTCPNGELDTGSVIANYKTIGTVSFFKDVPDATKMIVESPKMASVYKFNGIIDNDNTYRTMLTAASRYVPGAKYTDQASMELNNLHIYNPAGAAMSIAPLNPTIGKFTDQYKNFNAIRDQRVSIVLKSVQNSKDQADDINRQDTVDRYTEKSVADKRYVKDYISLYQGVSANKPQEPDDFNIVYKEAVETKTIQPGNTIEIPETGTIEVTMRKSNHSDPITFSLGVQEKDKLQVGTDMENNNLYRLANEDNNIFMKDLYTNLVSDDLDDYKVQAHNEAGYTNDFTTKDSNLNKNEDYYTLSPLADNGSFDLKLGTMFDTNTWFDRRKHMPKINNLGIYPNIGYINDNHFNKLFAYSYKPNVAHDDRTYQAVPINAYTFYIDAAQSYEVTPEDFTYAVADDAGNRFIIRADNLNSAYMGNVDFDSLYQVVHKNGKALLPSEVSDISEKPFYVGPELSSSDSAFIYTYHNYLGEDNPTRIKLSDGVSTPAGSIYSGNSGAKDFTLKKVDGYSIPTTESDGGGIFLLRFTCNGSVGYCYIESLPEFQKKISAGGVAQYFTTSLSGAYSTNTERDVNDENISTDISSSDHGNTEEEKANQYVSGVPLRRGDVFYIELTQFEDTNHPTNSKFDFTVSFNGLPVNFDTTKRTPDDDNEIYIDMLQDQFNNKTRIKYFQALKDCNIAPVLTTHYPVMMKGTDPILGMCDVVLASCARQDGSVSPDTRITGIPARNKNGVVKYSYTNNTNKSYYNAKHVDITKTSSAPQVGFTYRIITNSNIVLKEFDKTRPHKLNPYPYMIGLYTRNGSIIREGSSEAPLFQSDNACVQCGNHWYMLNKFADDVNLHNAIIFMQNDKIYVSPNDDEYNSCSAFGLMHGANDNSFKPDTFWLRLYNKCDSSNEGDLVLKIPESTSVPVTEDKPGVYEYKFKADLSKYDISINTNNLYNKEHTQSLFNESYFSYNSQGTKSYAIVDDTSDRKNNANYLSLDDGMKVTVGFDKYADGTNPFKHIREAYITFPFPVYAEPHLKSISANSSTMKLYKPYEHIPIIEIKASTIDAVLTPSRWNSQLQDRLLPEQKVGLNNDEIYQCKVLGNYNASQYYTDLYFWVPLSAGEQRNAYASLHVICDNAPSSCSQVQKLRVNSGYSDHYSSSLGDGMAVDLVGRIGALTVNDTADYRWSDTFKKETKDDEWYAYGLIHKVTTEPKTIFTDPWDIRGKFNNWYDSKHATSEHSSGQLVNSSNFNNYGLVDYKDPYESSDKVGAKKFKLPFDTSYNIHPGLRTSFPKMGYNTFYSFETIGGYFSQDVQDNDIIDNIKDNTGAVNTNNDFGQEKIQIIPIYYDIAVDEDGNYIIKPVDAYMRRSDNTYVLFNKNLRYAGMDTTVLSLIKDNPYMIYTTNNDAYVKTDNDSADPDAVYRQLNASLKRQNVRGEEAMYTRIITNNYYQEALKAYSKTRENPYSEITKLIKDSYSLFTLNTLIDAFSITNSHTSHLLGNTYCIGNGQILYLRARNRTFIGGDTLALGTSEVDSKIETDMTTRLNAQKYYFPFAVPASTQFAYSNYKPKASDNPDDVFIKHIEQTENRGQIRHYIMAKFSIIANGNTWTLEYNTPITQPKTAYIDFDNAKLDKKAHVDINDFSNTYYFNPTEDDNPGGANRNVLPGVPPKSPTQQLSKKAISDTSVTPATPTDRNETATGNPTPEHNDAPTGSGGSSGGQDPRVPGSSDGSHDAPTTPLSPFNDNIPDMPATTNDSPENPGNGTNDNTYTPESPGTGPESPGTGGGSESPGSGVDIPGNPDGTTPESPGGGTTPESPGGGTTPESPGGNPDNPGGGIPTGFIIPGDNNDNDLTSTGKH